MYIYVSFSLSLSLSLFTYKQSKRSTVGIGAPSKDRRVVC